MVPASRPPAVHATASATPVRETAASSKGLGRGAPLGTPKAANNSENATRIAAQTKYPAPKPARTDQPSGARAIGGLGIRRTSAATSGSPRLMRSLTAHLLWACGGRGRWRARRARAREDRRRERIPGRATGRDRGGPRERRARAPGAHSVEGSRYRPTDPALVVDPRARVPR